MGSQPMPLVKRTRAGARSVLVAAWCPLPGALAVLAGMLVGNGVAEAPKDVPPAKGYREVVLPFVEKHCLECHGAKKAKAGFRIDLLGTNFATANVAGHWKEVLDRINAG